MNSHSIKTSEITKFSELPELILPAGSMDTLKAGILNGADAVYLGSTKHNARTGAQNFFDLELFDAIKFAKHYNKKVYLTLNTLVKDEELEEAILIASKAYEFGVDAIIIQDLGLLYALKKLLPNLELHASTQMNCHSVEGLRMLANLGFKRVVLSRELNLIEIKKICAEAKKLNVKTEVFIHGAMCFSYSGQCMFSSFLFNKSGNRGKCLQPCRMPFTRTFANAGSTAETDFELVPKFFLSMKDLCSIDEMDSLIKAGIDSFKIEGRLKGVTYVAAVARAYRKRIDDYFGIVKKTKSYSVANDSNFETNFESNSFSEKDKRLLKTAFLREHSTGYQSHGATDGTAQKSVLSFNTPEHKGLLAGLIRGSQNGIVECFENIALGDRLSIAREDKRIDLEIRQIIFDNRFQMVARKGQIVQMLLVGSALPRTGEELYFLETKELKDFAFSSLKRLTKKEYSLNVKMLEGKPLSAVIHIGSKSTNVSSDFIVQPSKTQATSQSLLIDKLCKENDFLKPAKNPLMVEGSEKAFVSLSELKKFKNVILAAGTELLFNDIKKKLPENFDKELGYLLAEKKVYLKEYTRTQKFAIILPEKYSINILNEVNFFEACSDVILFSMDVFAIEKAVSDFPNKKVSFKSSQVEHEFVYPKTFVKKFSPFISNLGSLEIATSQKTPFIAERELNCFNGFAAQLLSELGASAIVPSIELSLDELEFLAKNSSVPLLPIAFFYPQLLISRAYSSSKKGSFVLSDRKNFVYNAHLSKDGLVRVYNPVPVDMLFELNRLLHFEKIILDFSACEEKEILEVLDYAKKMAKGLKAKKESKFTRGHYDRPVE
jgi:putative protease